MAVILLRIGIGVLIFVIIILNTVYPAFRNDLPLFWMFRGRKYYKRYRREFEMVEEAENESRVLDELNKRTQKLKEKGNS